jgi:N-acetylglucosaminyldiphosphoundecaprenol N-acetyl-beta-D-mannosaminyltransferase
MNSAVPHRIRVAGCPVDSISFVAAVDEICRRIETRRKTHIVFINAAKVVKYASDQALARVINRADLLLADGVPIVWASRLQGMALPERVNGTDLMEKMVEVAAERGYAVFLLGASQQLVEAAAQQFKRKHPGLRLVGVRNGYFSDDESDEIVEQINACNPDLILLGMGTPQKEIWGDGNLNKVNALVCQGVGGSFDVIAGATKRAPRWMQVSGLEWFYRFLQEPRRMWKRYLFTNSLFLWLVIRSTALSLWRGHHLLRRSRA